MKPSAEQFLSAFGVGEEGKPLHPIDVAGVALASIQALHEIILDQDAEISGMRDRLDSLKKDTHALRERLANRKSPT